MTRYLSVDEFLGMFPLDAMLKKALVERAANGQVLPVGSAEGKERLAIYISQAEDEADSYLRFRYVLPLVTVPPVLKPFIADLARHRFYSEKTTLEIKGRRDEAVSFLNKVRRGEVQLGLPNEAAQVSAVVGLPMVSDKPARDTRSTCSLNEWKNTFGGF